VSRVQQAEAGVRNDLRHANDGLAKLNEALALVAAQVAEVGTEAKRAQRTAELAGVSRQELTDLTHRLVGLRDEMGGLEARKCEKSALAELAKALNESFHGGLDQLQGQLSTLVAAAVAEEAAKLEALLAGLQEERGVGHGRDTLFKEELQGLAQRLGGKAGREELQQLQRALAALKPGGQSEERLHRIRDALLQIHSTMMETKADKAQLAKIEHALERMAKLRPGMPAGTRPAPLQPRPLHERLLVGHVAEGGITVDSRQVPGGTFLPRSTSPRLSGSRPASAAALLPPRPQTEYDRAEMARVDTERLIAESAPVLAPVEARTFELPQPRSEVRSLPPPRELREQPLRSASASAIGGAVAGARMLPGRDGRLYKAGSGPRPL